MQACHGNRTLIHPFFYPLPFLVSTPFCRLMSCLGQMEKEQRRRANFAVASRDDGAWSQIVKQKEAELRAKKEEP